MISVEEHFIIKSGLRWQLYGAPIYLLILTSKIQTLINIALILFPEAKGIAEFEKEQILNLTNSMGLKLATLQLMRPVYLGRPETQSQHSLYIAHFSLARPAWYEFGPCW